MFKKTIKYSDFNDVEHTEDFYFHVSKADVLAMGVGAEAMQARFNRIISARDGHALMKEMRDFIQLGYGRRSDDGAQFIKTPEITQTFMSSTACDELLVELCTNAQSAVDFVTTLIPEKLVRELAAAAEKNSAVNGPTPTDEDDRPDWLKEGRTPTQAEIRSATPEQLKHAWTMLAKSK